MRDKLEVVDCGNDPTLACNAARVASYLRHGSENAHTFKQIYTHFGHRCHNARLEAVGVRNLNFYNQKYGRNYGPEVAQMSKLHLEYLVMAGMYNRFHAKFFR